MLTDLADAALSSGLRVVTVPGWETRTRPPSSGPFNPGGQLVHHTGSKDVNPHAISDDLAYADWLARIGRSDLPAPLCQLSLGHSCVVFVCAAGRGNHAGIDRDTGRDGNRLRLGIEFQNTGTEGWQGVGLDAFGDRITQWEAATRLSAALNVWYHWPLDNTRAHKEQSVTGKWDPGEMDMSAFRSTVGHWMTHPKENDVALTENEVRRIAEATAKATWEHKVPDLDGNLVPARVLLNRANDVVTPPKTGGA